jgi:hypothetical protein
MKVNTLFLGTFIQSSIARLVLFDKTDLPTIDLTARPVGRTPVQSSGGVGHLPLESSYNGTDLQAGGMPRKIHSNTLSVDRKDTSWDATSEFVSVATRH